MKPIRLAAANKYHAARETADGYTFDSKAEAKHYRELRLRERAGEIRDLVVHPRFPLKVNGHLVCVMVPDFQYRENGVLVVEDVKSKATITAVYRVKAKLLHACHGITVREVMV